MAALSELEHMCSILQKCELLISLNVCHDIILAISEFSIGNVEKCEYYEYCKNFVIASDEEIKQYIDEICPEQKWYPGHWIYQYLCDDCKSKSVECGRDLIQNRHCDKELCTHLALHRKCKSKSCENIIDICSKCSMKKCSHCDYEFGRNLCEHCQINDNNGIDIVHKQSYYGIDGLRLIKEKFIYCNRGCGNVICKQCYYNCLSRCERCNLTFCKDCIEYCDGCNGFRCHSTDDSDCYYTKCRYGNHMNDFEREFAYDDYVTQRALKHG